MSLSGCTEEVYLIKKSKLFIVISSIISHLLGVKSVDAVQSLCRTSVVSEDMYLAARSLVTILVHDSFGGKFPPPKNKVLDPHRGKCFFWCVLIL
jgi:hypothetical protein